MICFRIFDFWENNNTWPYKWVTGEKTLLREAITPFITHIHFLREFRPTKNIIWLFGSLDVMKYLAIEVGKLNRKSGLQRVSVDIMVVIPPKPSILL